MFHVIQLRVSVLVVLLALSAAPSMAQQRPVDVRQQYPACASADLDTSLRFGIEANGDHRVVIDRENVSDHACVLPGFDVNLNLTQNFYREPLGGPVVALPGQTGEEVVRWSAVPLNDKTKCVKLEWMRAPILAVVPSLLHKVCSEVNTSLWTLTESPADHSADPPASIGSNRDPQEPALQLTSDKNVYDDGESFVLHVTRDSSNEWAPPEDSPCPLLVLSVNSPGHEVRVDEVQPIAFQNCGPDQGIRSTQDWKTGFDLNSGMGSRWGGTGEHSLQVFALASSPKAAELRFVASNVLRLQILDPLLIPRKWGPLTMGLHASIALDKDTYRVGEDVPLHIAIQNLSSDQPVYSTSPIWDPFETVWVEVLNERGQPLTVAERLRPARFMTGHGRGLMAFEKGKPVALEWTLGRLGWLPKNIGSYTIIAMWAPCITANADTTGTFIRVDPKSCVPVRATAAIQIIAASANAK